MNRYCYQNQITEFLQEDKGKWLDEMKSTMMAISPLPLSSSQVHAWDDCFTVLHKELPAFAAKHPEFSILFEYILPYESGRRPDVVLLSDKQVIILEFKMKRILEQADQDQCTAYGRDIREYHFESRNRQVLDALVLTQAKGLLERDTTTGSYYCSGDRLCDLLENTVVAGGKACNVDTWADSRYEPLPTIVEAAKLFMKNEPLPNIRRVNSTGIPDAIECLTQISHYAEENNEHIIAFVTGVPGAGKTFLGLQYVYDVCKENGLVNSVYLSGNGPLVEVLTDALHSKVFVKDLHSVINEFLQRRADDFQKNIIVFDEGQRAWDVKQMSDKGKSRTESEPDVMIRLCEERLNWCVLLILVGEGQEIYKGENSGIEQWNTALNKGSAEWKVVCPDKLKSVFDRDQEIMEVEGTASLDLTVSLRTHLAGDVSAFANSLIEGNIAEAQKKVQAIYKAGFSMFITRDVQKAKDYCNVRYEGDLNKRYGLIASSKGRELPRFGVDNSFYGAINRGKYGKWFNSDKGSGYSCCDLKSVVTEFGIQGLELDMPIVCWDRDMVWNGSSWDLFKPNESREGDDNVYRINSYRVLLTRGRDGFIIFVPPIGQLDKLYTLLKSMGIKELGVSSVDPAPVIQEATNSRKPTPSSAAAPTATVVKGTGSGLVDFFKSNGLEVIDKRANGGCLWVVGSQEQLEPYISKAKELYGATGSFAAGRATKQRMGWYTKSDK